jgi:SAM-dependent methyltransferase
MYNLMYRLSRPPWDTGVTPPEVVAVIEEANHLPSGRALDLGCGTGTNVIYLAQHGWDAVGVDFSHPAIEQARRKSTGVPGARFTEGDVSRLARLGIEGPFDFVLDIGCFHGLPGPSRQRYARELGRVTRPGAIFMLWAIAAERRRGLPGIPSMDEKEVAEHFGQDFDVERIERGTWRWPTNWYTLRRR